MGRYIQGRHHNQDELAEVIENGPDYHLARKIRNRSDLSDSELRRVEDELDRADYRDRYDYDIRRR